MKWFGNSLLLRRLVKAMERIADAGERQASVSETLLAAQQSPRTKPRPTEFGEMDVAAIEKRWRADREAMGQPVDD